MREDCKGVEGVVISALFAYIGLFFGIFGIYVGISGKNPLFFEIISSIFYETHEKEIFLRIFSNEFLSFFHNLIEFCF